MASVVAESGCDARITEIKTLMAGLGNVEKRELFTEMLEVVSRLGYRDAFKVNW